MGNWGELLPHLEAAMGTCPACRRGVTKPGCVPHESKVYLDYNCQHCGLEFRVIFELNAFAIAKRAKKEKEGK